VKTNENPLLRDVNAALGISLERVNLVNVDGPFGDVLTIP
jgi:hypothetical protein